MREIFFILVKCYSISPIRAHTFVAHHEKSPVPVIFKVSFDHLFDNLESGKINSCFGKN